MKTLTVDELIVGNPSGKHLHLSGETLAFMEGTHKRVLLSWRDGNPSLGFL